MASEERLLSTKSTNMGSTWHDLAQPRLNIGSGEAQMGAKIGQHGPKMPATGGQNCEVCVSFVDFERYVAKHRFPYSFYMVHGAQQRPRRAKRGSKRA